MLTPTLTLSFSLTCVLFLRFLKNKDEYSSSPASLRRSVQIPETKNLKSLPFDCFSSVYVFLFFSCSVSIFVLCEVVVVCDFVFGSLNDDDVLVCVTDSFEKREMSGEWKRANFNFCFFSTGFDSLMIFNLDVGDCL
jgi:hypothetical protein